MGLPWARLDANIASNDKVLDLLSIESPAVHQAAFSYLCSIAWSVGNGTNGRVTKSALVMVHGTPETAGLLCDVRLWIPARNGWQINAFDRFQQTTAETEKVHSDRSRAGSKGMCSRYHGPGCWSPSTGCTVKAVTT